MKQVGLLKKALVISLICLVVGILAFLNSRREETMDKGIVLEEGTLEEHLKNVREDSYTYYLHQHKDASRLDIEISLGLEDYNMDASYHTSVLEDYEGRKQAIETAEDSELVYDFYSEEEGLYAIKVLYYPMEGKSSDIEREILINNELPFINARQIVLSRTWTDKEEVTQDNQGNDIKPQQIEAPRWMEDYVMDANGYSKEPYLFYFKKGNNRLTLKAVREPLVVDKILLTPVEKKKSYNELELDLQTIKKDNSTFISKVQGEKMAYKSDPTLYPLNDRSSPITEPYHPYLIRLNMVGSDKWKLPGQWIEWEVDVPQDGYYKIGLQQKQDIERGVVSYRKLLIDGKVPFAEMEAIPFSYNTEWETKILGDEEDPYYYYLTRGTHNLHLEVVLGELGPILQQVEDSTYKLNEAYRRILMLTGSEPDIFRDYNIEKRLPEVLDTFREQSHILYGVMNRMVSVSGQKGSSVATIEKLAFQLNSMADDPDSIPKRFQTFKSNVGALGTWLLDVREQPLAIDYITVSAPNVDIAGQKSSVFKKAVHESKAFFASFFNNYNNIGSVGDQETKPLKVWVLQGRDQAQIVKRMIEDDFKPKTGIEVDVSIVQGGGLLPATVSGRAPDIAMQVPIQDPVDYALRNAVMDLSQFEDFQQIKERFYTSAVVPYEFNGGVYALPETQEFPVLFYRKDILEEIGVEIPQTWEDVINILPEVQKRNMNFGLPVAGKNESGKKTIQSSKVSSNGLTTYAMLLFQSGGHLYTENHNRVDLETPEAIQAFEMWTDFYTNYKLPQDFDFVNRFRTGEIPIGISDYTAYNKLSVFAPEIRGLWGFTALPGMVKEDGRVDRSVASKGLGTIILQQSEMKDQAWEYVKWWTSADIQERFGREMESLMGAAARYPTANIEAVSKLPWPVKDYNSLMAQWEWVVGKPEVPGGYFVPRHLDNAFRKVVLAFENPRETILDYIKIINIEIEKKRMEFGLPTNSEEE